MINNFYSICYFTCFMDDEEMPDELNTRECQEICDSDIEDEHQAFLNQAKKDIENAACKFLLIINLTFFLKKH